MHWNKWKIVSGPKFFSLKLIRYYISWLKMWQLDRNVDGRLHNRLVTILGSPSFMINKQCFLSRMMFFVEGLLTICTSSSTDSSRVQATTTGYTFLGTASLYWFILSGTVVCHADFSHTWDLKIQQYIIVDIMHILEMYRYKNIGQQNKWWFYC